MCLVFDEGQKSARYHCSSPCSIYLNFPIRTNTRAHTARPRTANPTACPLHYRPFYYLPPYCPPTATLAARSPIRNSSPHLFDRPPPSVQRTDRGQKASAATREAPVRIPNADSHYSRDCLLLPVSTLHKPASYLPLCCYSYLPCHATPIFTLLPKVYDIQKSVCLVCLWSLVLHI